MKVALDNNGGVLLVLDDYVKNAWDSTGPATAFSRIWCAFEESKALDLGMSLEGEKVELLTEGVTEDDIRRGGDNYGTAEKAERESTFPVGILDTALCVQLELAEASQESDKRHILNCLIGESDLEKEPMIIHPNFVKAKCRLRCKFAVVGWRAKMDTGDCLNLFSEAVRSDEWLEGISRDFNSCDKMNDKAVIPLAAALPKNLQELSLNLRCTAVSDIGLECIASAFKKITLKKLELDLPAPKT